MTIRRWEPIEKALEIRPDDARLGNGVTVSPFGHLGVRGCRVPALDDLPQALSFGSLIKIGRTHVQDATPLTLGQEFGGYEAQRAVCEESIQHASAAVHALAIGGTALGTGLNPHPESGARVAAKLARRLELPLVYADNLHAAMTRHEALSGLHANLKMLAIALIKIGSVNRLMGSGSRAGLGEQQLPQSEPGSSIVPGEVNPTQIEALTRVCAQIMDYEAAIGFAASEGLFGLNVYKPLFALDTLDSIRLLTDVMRSFTRHCVVGIEVHSDRIKQLVRGSPMLATALAPHVGHDRSAQIAKHAAARPHAARSRAGAWICERRAV